MSLDPNSSIEYGRIPLKYFLALWHEAEGRRFRYRPIRVWTTVILLMLSSLWGYYIHTLGFGAGLSVGTFVVGLVLLFLTLLATLLLLRWRLFVRQSAVLVTDKALIWRSGQRCFLAPWRLIDPNGLGLAELGLGGGYESKLVIKIGDTAEPLFLIRAFTKLDDQEGFLGELLLRIPRESWATPPP